jgi:sulfatase modifying factor 1
LNMMRSLIVIFSILNASSIFLYASPSDSGSGDRFNFSSLVSREGPSVIASLGDLPDNIMPVDVRDAGNQNDPDTGLGMVIQEYSIAQTEVTAKQYCDYLNVVATGDNYQLFYNEKMGSDPNVASIQRTVIDGKNQYNVIKDQQGDRSNFPIVYASLYQAARFCNWLQNQSTPGLTGDDLTEHGAYTLNGKSSGPIARNPGAIWFIPTESEWYKPAYYKGGGLQQGYWHFANRSDWAPSNDFNGKKNAANYYCSGYTKQGPPYLTEVNHFRKSVGTYNTYDMSGNVAEWVATEEKQGAAPLKYVARGGSWKSLYYGAAVEDKLDTADWGIELSKWSRPAYDPAQGYDNIGFRVATSLIVNSVPPDTAAPGATELSPTEALEAIGVPFIALVGIATVFSGKKIYDRCNAERVRVAEAQQREEQRQRAVGGSITTNEGGEARDPSATAHIGEGSQAPLTARKGPGDFKRRFQEWNGQPGFGPTKIRARVTVPSPEKVKMTQQEKAEIEEAMEAIDPLFEEAVQKHQAYKDFLNKKGETDPGGLQQLEEMCDAYEAYKAAVEEAAEKMKTFFPEEPAVWIPWYTVAMNVASEAIVLRNKAITPYYRFNIFTSPEQTVLRERVLALRKKSNQQTIDHIEIIHNYQEVLKELVQEEGDSSLQNVAAETLQKVRTEKTFLKTIATSIEKHEGAQQTPQAAMTGAQDVNIKYSDYVSEVAKRNENMYPLFYSMALNQAWKKPIINLVSSLNLKEQVQQLLNQVETHEEIFSPGGLSPERMMEQALTPRSGGSIGAIYSTKNKQRDSIGGMNNPQNPKRMLKFEKRDEESREEGASIKGQILPRILEEQFREQELTQFQQTLLNQRKQGDGAFKQSEDDN